MQVARLDSATKWLTTGGVPPSREAIALHIAQFEAKMQARQSTACWVACLTATYPLYSIRTANHVSRARGYDLREHVYERVLLV